MSGLADWTRSSACTYGNCVEARFCDGHIELRDTRNPGPILVIEVDDWVAFIAGAKNGEFDVAGAIAPAADLTDGRRATGLDAMVRDAEEWGLYATTAEPKDTR